MFTGLIEEVGRLRHVRRQGQAMVLSIEADRVTEDVRIGDSIAVNGVCLTVVAFDDRSFAADVMPETFRQTTLRLLRPGDPVNLERAMKADRRFGGHLVQGHIDAMGTIRTRTPEDNAVVFGIEATDPACMKYVVPRGSIAVDGISLTVVRADDRGFAVSIIPHTLAGTALRYKQPGDLVNLETDILGRYVKRLLSYRLTGRPPEAAEAESAGTGSPRRGGATGLTKSFLREHGFL